MESRELIQQSLSKALAVPMLLLGGLAAIAFLVTMFRIFRQARGPMRPIAAILFLIVMLSAALAVVASWPK